MKTGHSETIQAQFDAQAQAYLQSAVHAAGPDLIHARELVTAHTSKGELLDAGCGAGHLSFALAPLVDRAIALDPSPNMLATVEEAAAQRGLGQLRTVQAKAESMPFDNARFDIVASRYSAHHWRDLPAALEEIRRVIKPGGRFLMIDIEGCEDALVDTHLQTMEILRDRSHVRDRSPSEWAHLLEQAGFTAIRHWSWPTRLEFASWVTRMRTSSDRVTMLRQLQREAPEEVRNALAIEEDGSFTAMTGLWWAQA